MVRLAFVGILAMIITPAFAHSWYSPECCADKDCAATDSVYEGPTGYGTPWGLIPFGDSRIKQSQDDRFHLCIVTEYPGRLSKIIPPLVRCLYVPFRGL